MPVPASSNLRIFVVDDEPLIAMTLSLILKQHGYEATSYFTDPLLALEAARRDGIELAVQVTTFAPLCRVLLFSGQATASDMIDRAGQNGRDFELLAKPLHPSLLLQRLSSFAAAA
jgi:DNA-binding response OmpR family regulator